MNQEPILEYKIQTPLGPAYFQIQNENKIISFDWVSRPNNGEPIESSFLATELQNQVTSYFEKKLKYFDLPTLTQGTDFQQKVWKALKNITYGTTLSYQELGQEIGFKKSARAIGSAVGKNPICLIIPCHRIIRSSGELGGFSGGVARKKSLLNLENKIHGI